MSYEYSKISDQQSIRLLEIHQGDVPSEVECKLHHVALSANPSYEALSYVWGSPIFDSHLTCNGLDLPVTASLYRMLKELRMLTESRFVWIDAVCINQKDIPERNQQVQLMRDIYVRCKRVIIWLGEDHEKLAAEAFQTMHEIEVFTQTNREQLEPGTDPQRVLYEHFGWELETSASLRWAPLAKVLTILRRDWFERIWVVQEVIAATKAIVMCGGYELLWAALQHTCELLMRFLEPGRAARAALQVANMALVSYHMAEGTPYDLLTLAEVNQRCKATDPRDKLYGLLGLSTDAQFFEPDYGLPVEDVYRRFAIHTLRRGDNLYVLSRCQYNEKRESQLPTWVPDWRRQVFRRSDNDGSGSEVGIFDASATKSISISFLNDRTLVVKGILVDRVKFLRWFPSDDDYPSSGDDSEAYDSDDDGHQPDSGDKINVELADKLNTRPPVIGKTWLQECYDMASKSLLYQTPDNLIDAFWRTMVLGRDVNGDSVTEEYRTHYVNYSEVDQWLIEGVVRQKSQDAEYEDKLESSGIFQQAMNSFQAGKTFCVTEKGHIGWIPPEAMDGDVIFILYGGKVPYLLRPQTMNRYLLIGGECYVHGLMHGEIFESSHCADAVDILID